MHVGRNCACVYCNVLECVCLCKSIFVVLSVSDVHGVCLVGWACLCKNICVGVGIRFGDVCVCLCVGGWVSVCVFVAMRCVGCRWGGGVR